MSTYPNIIAAKDARIAELEAEVERLKHDGFLARVAEYFDASELAGSFMPEDGDGGFLAAIHGMTKEIARLRAEALSRTGAVKAALSGDTSELIDRMAVAIREDGGHYDDAPWDSLSDERKEGWRGDARRALAVVKEYLTARLPSEQAVTEAMVEAAQRIRDVAMRQTVIARLPECGEFGAIAQDADWLVDALKAAMEAGG